MRRALRGRPLLLDPRLGCLASDVLTGVTGNASDRRVGQLAALDRSLTGGFDDGPLETLFRLLKVFDGGMQFSDGGAVGDFAGAAGHVADSRTSVIAI